MLEHMTFQLIIFVINITISISYNYGISKTSKQGITILFSCIVEHCVLFLEQFICLVNRKAMQKFTSMFL